MLDVPKARVEHVAFVQQDLAADHLVARGGVAGEIDAAHEELLAFIGRQGEVDLVAAGEIEGRLRHEIDESEFAVELAHLLQALAQLGCGEDIAFRHAEQAARQRFRRAEELHAHVVDLLQVEQPALFHRDGDIHRLARMVFLEQRNA